MAPNDATTVALWGTTQSGKTSFLAQLYLHPGSFRGNWDIFPTKESEQFIDEMREYLRRSEFPDPTRATTVRNVTYGFKDKLTGQEALLFVEDRAGAESEQLDEAARNRLNQASGLVVLFDPQRHLRDLEQQIEKTLGRLHTARDGGFQKDPRPIAVCLSKADTLIKSPEDLVQARTRPREFVKEHVKGDILAWLGNFCSNFELFPVSSLGVRARFGVVEPIIFYDETCRPRIGPDSEPINLIEPFVWIFRKLSEKGTA
jgi:hypothetical protein